jgi:hypothetical protein
MDPLKGGKCRNDEKVKKNKLPKKFQSPFMYISYQLPSKTITARLCLVPKKGCDLKFGTKQNIYLV